MKRFRGMQYRQVLAKSAVQVITEASNQGYRVRFGTCSLSQPNGVTSGNSDLEVFSKAILKQTKDKNTTTTLTWEDLRDSIPVRWWDEERDDVVNPCDARFTKVRLKFMSHFWIFDLPKGTLLLVDRDHRSRIALSRLESHPVSFDDMELLGPAIPQIPQIRPKPIWQLWRPSFSVEPRRRAFTHRLLRDFDHCWNYIHRDSYNDVTRRRLANAAIRLATLDFSVLEVREGRGSFELEPIRQVCLPRWEPLEANILQLGEVFVVVDEGVEHGFSRAQDHARQGRLNSSTSFCPVQAKRVPQPRYIILSVKHIVVAAEDETGQLLGTVPELLFNGGYYAGPPTSLALDYLLWGTTSIVRTFSTRLQLLPTEIQDLILYGSSLGSVSAAHIGCVLQIGSPFLWKEDNHGIESLNGKGKRTVHMPVENCIQFGERHMGLIYRVEAS